MKIVFDARFTRPVHHDGISRYGASLLEALSRLHPVTGLVHDPAQLDMLPTGVQYVRINAPTSPAELAVAHRVNALGADVVFSPMQVMGSAGRRYGLILTLHDLIYYTNPTPPADQPPVVRAAWRAYHKAWWPQRFLLNRADAVATVSWATKRAMADHRLSRRPVVVIPNAPAPVDHPVLRPGPDGAASPDGSPTFRPGADGVPPVGGSALLGPDGAASPGRPGAERGRRLLYMGSFTPYKNVETLVDAMAHLPGYELHLLSRIAEDRRAALAGRAAPGVRLVFHDGTDEADYAALLDEAFALVTASLDEGFGLPVVEAMSHALPVVVSDLPAFREICGADHPFFPARDPLALAERVRALEDPARWREAARTGLERSARWTWDRSARRLLGLMRRVHEVRTGAGPGGSATGES